MAAPSASIVYTGESGDLSGVGRGAAYSEGIGSTLEIINKGLTDIRAHEKERKEEQEKKNAAWNKMLEDEDQDVWDMDVEKVTEKGKAYNDFVFAKRKEGLDPSNLPEADEKERRRLLNDLKREAKAAHENKAWYDQEKAKVDGDTKNFFDKQHAADYFGKFKTSGLLPSERNKMIREGSPLSKNVNLTDVVGVISEQITPDELYEKGYDIKRKDPKKFENLLGIYFKDAAGSDDYDALLKQYNNDPKALMDAAKNAFTTMNADERKKRPVTASSKTTTTTKPGSEYGTGKWGGLTVVAGPNKSSMFNQSVPKNTIAVKRNGTNADLPPVFITHMGQDISFQPVSYHMGPGNKITVYGNGINDDGTLVKGLYVDYDEANNATTFASQLEGMDVRQEFAAQNGGGIGTGVAFTGIPTTGKFNGQ